MVMDAAGYWYDPRSELRVCIWSKWKIDYFKHVKLSASSHSIAACSTSIYHCRDGIYFAVKEASLSENNIKVQQCVSQLEQVHEIAYTFVFFLCHHTSRDLWIKLSYRCFICFSIFSLFSLLYFLFSILCLLLLPWCPFSILCSILFSSLITLLSYFVFDPFKSAKISSLMLEDLKHLGQYNIIHQPEKFITLNDRRSGYAKPNTKPGSILKSWCLVFLDSS